MIDAYVQGKYQAAYDYVWDRWGVLLGHARGTAAFLFYVTPLVMLPFEGKPMSPWLWFMVAANLYCIEVFSIRPHFQRDVHLQRNGSFAKMNTRAMEYVGMFWWLKWIMVLWFGLTFFADGKVDWLIQSTSAFTWVYLLGVQVRDRDSSRFEQRDVSFAGA